MARWSDTSSRSPHAHPLEPVSAMALLDCLRSPPSPTIVRRATGSEPGRARTSVTKSLGGFSRPTLTTTTAARCARRHPVGVHRVGIRPSVGGTRACRQAGSRSVSETQTSPSSGPHRPVGHAVDAGPHPRRRRTPTVHGEHPDRDARQCGGKPPEHAGLRAVGVDDVGPEPAQSRRLPEAGGPDGLIGRRTSRGEARARRRAARRPAGPGRTTPP